MTMTAKQYLNHLRQARRKLKPRVVKLMNKVGKRWQKDVVDKTPKKTWLLAESFYLEEATKDDFTIVLISEEEYASFVEEGHHQKERWVPGYWEGNMFIYSRGAGTGMRLTDKWIEGNHVVWVNKQKAIRRLQDGLGNLFSQFESR